MLGSMFAVLILSQIIFFGGMLACIVIKPAGLGANDGISYYGTYAQTIVPYIFALAGSSLAGLYAVNKFIRASGFNYVKLIMLTIFVLAIGVILTPYDYNRLFSNLHELFGTLTFILQGVLSIRLVFFVLKDRTNMLLILIELIGGLMSAYYLNPKQGLLIQGQMIFQLGFGLILIRSSALLSKSPEKIKA